MAADPIKIGIIGLSTGGSWVSRSHLKALQSRPESYKITALQNSSKASAEKASAAYDLPNVGTYGTPEELAADPNVELVLVSVKVPDHAAIVRSLLSAPQPKSVFVEWPLARNLAEAEELADLARRSAVRTMVGLQARYSPSILKAKEIVDSGLLGEVLSTTMRGYGLLYPPTGPITPYYEYTLDASNGAMLLSIAFGHAVDALCFVLGEFESLQATLLNRRKEYPIVAEEGSDEVLRTVKGNGHDYISVQGAMVKGGALASVVYSGGVSPSGQGFVWTIEGTEASILLEGPMGHVQMWQPSVKIIKRGVEGAKYEKIEVEEVGDDFSHNVGLAWDDFARHDSQLTTFETAVLRHKMVDAILRSNTTGNRESYL